MKSILSVVFLWGVASSALAQTPFRDCPAPSAQEPTTDRADWRLIENFADAKPLYENLYHSGKRIDGRAYWDASRKSYVLARGSQVKRISLDFLRRLSEQMATALDNGYADYLFYPDMGHFHLYATDEDSQKLQEIPDESLRFETMLALPGLKTLFHTAELIRLRLGNWFDGPLVDDPWLRWRYYSRNFIGENRDGGDVQVVFAKDERYNTIRSIGGYRERTALYVSASQAGCFPVTTKKGVVYFDLSDH